MYVSRLSVWRRRPPKDHERERQLAGVEQKRSARYFSIATDGQFKALRISTNPAPDWSNPQSLFMMQGTTSAGSGSTNYDVTRDGRQFLLVTPSDAGSHGRKPGDSDRAELARRAEAAGSGSVTVHVDRSRLVGRLAVSRLRAARAASTRARRVVTSRGGLRAVFTRSHAAFADSAAAIQLRSAAHWRDGTRSQAASAPPRRDGPGACEGPDQRPSR